MKKKEELYSAMGSIDEQLILDAAPDQKKSGTKIWVRWVAVAACMTLIVGVLGFEFWQKNPVNDPPTPEVNRISIPANIAEMLYAGNPGDVSDGTSSGTSSAPPPLSTNTVTAKVVKILPDSYKSFGSYSASTFRLVLMETVTDLGDVEMPQQFYLHIWENYYTDFSQYEYILINRLKQSSYEGAVVHNTTTGKAEAFELPVFSAYNYSCYYVYAFNNGVLDTSMWQSTEQWEKGFAQLEGNKNEDGTWKDMLIQRDATLAEAETIFADHLNSDYDYYNYQSFSSVTDPDALEALDYVKPFNNGIFAYHFDPHLGLGSLNARFIRYLNGFSTNEAVNIVNNGADYSLARFEPKDWESLPQLGKALAAVSTEYDVGNIKPPHLKESKKIEFQNYAITGKYIKCESGVYGLVTVRWNYKPVDSYNWVYVDECYYLIAPGEDSFRLVSNKELVGLFGDYAPEIYGGDYDELGRTEREPVIQY